MKLRLTHTKRKDYKTSEALDKNNITYLIWQVFPVEVDLTKIEEKIGLRIWIAGESVTEKWFMKEVHIPGSSGFSEGGYTAINPYGDLTYILNNEAILHPTLIKKRKTK